MRHSYWGVIVWSLLSSAGPSLAADADRVDNPSLLTVLSASGTIMLAIFLGAMSFAILSAVWMIRERGAQTLANQQLKQRLADMRAANEQYEALVNVADQRIVVWDSGKDRPTVMGALSRNSGAPAERGDFLAFGRWLATDSAIGFERALAKLRGDAEAFDLPLVTVNGAVIEAQGRTSGSHAFVRFFELTGERSALLRLEADHARLNATFDTLQALFQQLGHPVWLRDAAGRLFWTNAAYAGAVDCGDGNEAVERGVELLDSLQRQAVAQTQENGGVFSGALPAVFSGDRKTVEMTEVRTGTGSAGIAIDRSEVEQVKATLRRTTETHAQTLDHLATAIAMFDGGQRLQFYNSAFQNLWGLDSAFLNGGPNNAQVLDAIRAGNRLPESPDWRKWREHQLDIYKALEAREDWWHLPSGETLRVIINPHSQGGATWVFENVTEQLALQSNYNSLMRMQGETLDKLSEAIAVFGQDGKLKLSNPAFAIFWSMDAAKIANGVHISTFDRRAAELIHDSSCWDNISEAITGFDDTRDDLTGRIATTGGGIFDYRLVRLPEGQTMLAMADITASVNVERALKERNEALEQADRLKNRFIQHVSYELRAPLTSIAGFSELLADPQIGALNQKQSEYVDHVSSSAEVLKAIIDDILDLATIDAGAMRLDRETVDLNQFLKKCGEDVAAQSRARHIRIETFVANDAAAIDADPQRLRQIVSNLLKNAVSFSPDGGMVRLETRRSGDFLELSVGDEGPGVPEEYRDNIFDRFEGRTSGSRRRGTGLGLSIVKNFVELHGGSVRVEAAEQRGARFVCRFPATSTRARQAA